MVGFSSESRVVLLKSSALAFELNSSKADVGRSQVYSNGILHHFIIFYHFSSVVDFSLEKHSGSTRQRYS